MMDKNKICFINIDMNSSLFKKVLLGSVFGVIIIYVIISVVEYIKSKDEQDDVMFPPWPAKCPDYWKVVGPNQCQNVHNIGSCQTGNTKKLQTIDWSKYPYFKGQKGLYAKCQYSLKCNAPWEGIDTLCV